MIFRSTESAPASIAGRAHVAIPRGRADFRTRGRRVEEQIDVLRRLWTESYVTFNGRWHTLDGVGLNRTVAEMIPI